MSLSLQVTIINFGRIIKSEMNETIKIIESNHFMDFLQIEILGKEMI